jgi:hypothetical protein
LRDLHLRPRDGTASGDRVMAANDLVSFGKYRGRPIAEMLADADYRAWLRQDPAISAVIDDAVAVALAKLKPQASSTNVDEALDALAAAGILFRRAPNYEGYDVRLVAGKGTMLEVLRKRELRGRR